MAHATWTALVVLTGCGAAPVSPSAPGCPDGVMRVASRGDLVRLASCATLRGLTVRSGAALDVSALRALTTITGDLVIGPTLAVEDVELPALRTVGGAIRVVGNGLLRQLRLPTLELAGTVVIDGNPVVATIALPRLQTVHGALRITDNAVLELLDLAALASVDQELVFAGEPALALVEAEQLRHAAAVQIDAPRLPPDVTERLHAAAR
ncbi:MAG TPA: hypothetical protein VHT91_42250 [Kofleriaceae bacterium]|jgi:hypothetical protein|nr:hypothetical protein [Kofleriaceae bacterium]